MSKFTPTAQETALVNQIFIQVDTQKLGVITGDAAVKIFSGSKLSPTVLAEIWNIADEDNNGVLTRKGVAVALRLLGHAQRGEKVTEALIQRPGPPPTLEGFSSPILPQSTGVPFAKSPPPGLPPLTPQDKAKFMKLFAGAGPANGVLSGEKARDIFVKSKLPVEKLGQIWNLADTKSRGALDATDFTVAMYLIQASMSGHLQNIPAALPPSLYEQASGGPIAVHATGDSIGFGSPSFGAFPGRPASTVTPQFTGSGIQPQMTGQLRPQTTGSTVPSRPSPATSAFPFMQAQSTGTQHWDVSPAEKASSDKFFDGLDTQKRGYIEGDVAVPFMLQSKLPEDVLAQVWDLSDLNNDGKLTRDGFAVAMHLIQAKLSGKDLPSTISPSLIPPSMRGQTAQPAAHPHVPEAIRDLLWDDSPPASATTPQAPPPTLQPQSTGILYPRSAAASPSPRANTFTASDPFSNSPFAALPPATSHKNFLEDDDEHPAASPPLQDNSAEIGNLKNQLGSTNRSLETTKQERENLERALSDQAAQLSALQTQLSSAKAAYETETRLLATLRERYSTQQADIQKARHELITAESDLSAVRVEKSEIEGAFLRDKEEVRELQRKMAEVGGQVEALKADVEKTKKSAKQQKGLLAIAKKQLATREAEKAKADAEAAETRRDLDVTNKELQETEAELAKETPATTNGLIERAASPGADSLSFAAAHPLPGTPDLTSPLSPMSTGSKGTNPFDRIAMAGSPRSQSPFLPFATSAALPTPPTAPVEAAISPAPVAAAGNPFNFDQAFGTSESVPAEVIKAESESTAPPGLDDIDITSPTNSDIYATPPPTAPGFDGAVPREFTGEAVRYPAADAVPVTASPIAVTASEAFTEEPTDLNSQLREVEADESDSDTETEEDNEPLSDVTAKLSNRPAETSASGSAGPFTATAPAEPSIFDDPFAAAIGDEPERPASPTTSQPTLAPVAAPLADFDAAFAPSPTVKQTAVPTILPLETTETNGATPRSEPSAGVSDFDEALGKLSATPSTAAPSQFSQFTFDSAFDDNFDFAAASAAAPSEPPTNGHAQPATAPEAAASNGNAFDSIFMSQPSTSAAPGPATTSAPLPGTSSPFPAPPAAKAPENSFSFDNAFGIGNTSTAPESNIPANQSVTTNGSHGISFDDAFGGNLSDSLALDSSFASSTYQPPAGLPPPNKTQQPFSPTSPPHSPSPSAARSVSPELYIRRSGSPPPRHTTPPPRLGSPKPRTSSDKEKTPSTRTSKLSIRLPFGRKKHKQDTAPPLPSGLSHQALVEEPTPAVDDDVEGVKQLCNMGFSRTQAVTALENNSYDVQRALNSLLGTQ